MLTAPAGLRALNRCSLAWGDYDNDGDLDLALAGDAPTGSITRIYRNDKGFAPNTPPTAPVDLQVLAGGGDVLLSWGQAMDSETPQAGLSYNLRIGWNPTQSDSHPSMADALGIRTIPCRGPLVVTLSSAASYAWLALPPGAYYASVQGIDTSMRGGPWSEPAAFVVP